MVQIRIARSARHHKIGFAHILRVMATTEPVEVGDRLVYVGCDDRGVELEISIVPDDKAGWADCWTIVHAMPTGYRKRSTKGRGE